MVVSNRNYSILILAIFSKDAVKVIKKSFILPPPDSYNMLTR